jgi:hypothetical protein
MLSALGKVLILKVNTLNFSKNEPFLSRLFCASRLTAVGDMRHPLKANLGKK